MFKVGIHFNTGFYTQLPCKDPEELINQITDKKNDWLTLNASNNSTTYNKRLIAMVVVEPDKGAAGDG